MTLTFYDICLDYEVEHLQNDIESKEPREQTEQITTEYIEYIIELHAIICLCPTLPILCFAKW